MAGGGRIKGITIEINGDTTGLQDALKGVDKSLKDTQTQLKDVNKLLKVDPHNTELLRQQQELLGKAVTDTKEKLEKEKEALKQLEASGSTDPAVIEQQNALKREIIATEQALKSYQSQIKLLPVELQKISDVSGQVAEKTKGLSMAAAGAGAALLGNAYKAAKSVDELNTLSKQTGFSVEELQKMQYASELVDVSFDTMTGSMAKLTRNMSSGSDAFSKLGISVKDEMTGQLRDANTVWYETLWALSKVENETERDALAMQIFGKSAADLSGIVDDGGVALIGYGNEAKELGLILSQDDVDAANKFNDAMDTLKARTSAAFMEAGASLAETLAPALEKVVTAVTKALQWFSDLDGSTQAFILTVLGLVAAISPVAGIISTLTGLAAALNVAMLPMIGTTALIVAGIAAVVAIGVALYKNWDTVVASAKKLMQNLQTAFNNIRSTVSNVFNNVRNTISSVMSAAQNAVSSAVNRIKSLFNFSLKIPEVATGALDAARSAVDSVVGWIKGAFNFGLSLPSVATDVFSSVTSTVQGIVDRVKGAMNFSWSLPSLKVPKIIVNGGKAPWGIGGAGTPPSFSVQWHRDAYDNPLMFTRPTVLATPNGLHGFGDGPGAELVIGLNKLQKLVGASGNTINVSVYASPGMNETALANAVAVKLDKWLGERV